jgi:site-specific recombinase XerD
LLDKTIILHLEFILKFINWSDIALRKSAETKVEPTLFFDIHLTSETQIQDFLNDLKDKKYPQTYIISALTALSIFFRWIKFENLILVNPCENVKLKKPRGKLIVCDDAIIKKLMKFIKNPNSDPEQALILSLILIWGLRSEDLSHAKIEIKENTLKIILRRKQLGTKKYYNRSQILDLPNNPSSWFYLLQKRFYKDWLIQYHQRKKDFPCYNLLLPRYRSIQPLTKTTILSRVYEATQAAVRVNIAPKTLRKTCGHIHSTSSDASILSTLGWSADYCFDYTWVPKIYFQKPK